MPLGRRPIGRGERRAEAAALVVYLGVDTIYSLRDGWRRLVERTDAATTFDELRSAGEHFGKLMGANTARILVMVAAAAMGSGTGGVAKMMPTLPGAGQALTFAGADGVVVEAVQAVTIADSGLTLTLAPGAVAVSTVGTNGDEGNRGAWQSAAAKGPKLDMGKQGKHIPGHNNHIPGRSPLTHDPQGLLDRFAGKREPIGDVPANP